MELDIRVQCSGPPKKVRSRQIIRQRLALDIRSSVFDIASTTFPLISHHPLSTVESEFPLVFPILSDFSHLPFHSPLEDFSCS